MKEATWPKAPPTAPPDSPSAPEPHVGQSFDVHLKTAREQNRILKGLLDQARVELVSKQQSRAILEQCAGEEIDQLKADLQAAETKAGAMETQIAMDTECIERLRNHGMQAELDRDAALARAETAEAIIREAPHEPTCGSRDFPDRPLKCDCFKAKLLPPALSVASEKEGTVIHRLTHGEPPGWPDREMMEQAEEDAEPTLLPFDLAKALAGAKVVTRISDVVHDLEQDGEQICGFIGDSQVRSYWNKNGSFLGGEHGPLDLFLATSSPSEQGGEALTL